MREQNEIDELFRQGTQQHYPVDSNLWTQVEGQLPTNPSPSGFFSLNGILFVLVIFCCSLIPKDNSYSQQNTTSNNNITNPSKQKQLTDSKNTSQKPSETAKENTDTKQKNINKETSISSVSRAISSSTNPEGAVPVINPSNQSITNKLNNQKKDSQNDPSFSGFNKAKTTLNVDLTNLHKNSTFNPLAIELSKINLVGYTPIAAIALSQNPRFTNEIQQPIYKSTSKLYEIELLSSLFIQKQIKTNKRELLAYKKEAEEPVSNQTIGINTIQHKKRFTYGFGIQLNQYTERVRYAIERESPSYLTTIDTNYRVVNSGFNSNGVPVLLIEQVLTENRTPTTVIVNDQLTATNTIKRIRTPLLVGYNINYKNWHTELRSAIIPSVLFQAQGITANNNSNQIETLGTETIKRFGLSVNNQIRFGYHINESMALGTTIYIENDLRSYTEETNSKTNHQGLGIWLTIKP